MQNMNLLSEVRGHFMTPLPRRLGVALSGGGDSMALLHILMQCFQGQDVEILAATVDHGLRADSAQEAQQVSEMAAKLGVDHEVLQWQGWQGDGNLQDQARQARYQLLEAWASRNEIRVLVLGHTADDQAETVLMRLARSAGVDGLSAIPVRRQLENVTLLRPLLAVTRAQLRDYLTALDQTWIEDPSNHDQRFERVRIRQAMGVLEPLGLSTVALSTVAENMTTAREALEHYSFIAARDVAQIVSGAVVLDQSKLGDLPDEILHRVLTRALQWVSGATYPLRRRAMGEALEAVRSGGSLTLGGCRILGRAGRVWICRELNAVREEAVQPGQLWDNRWLLSGGDPSGIEVRSLGKAGLLLCPNWRQLGCPGVVLEATPALWNAQELVAAPLAAMGNKWTAKTAKSGEEFYASLLSH
ncbi:tRNA lysidine(34) synthetase TilS [Parasedimentitalea maritima]|uniref:tRNA(Ile)-lysidine synthase n=2 Tax=Parasedimentitalea maritima TaxID=2578117 RepID=A0A6A4RFB9_9RHOB|nr:tRNA lysidine(34) synthetase TilS [Zongyanglinia marina]